MEPQNNFRYSLSNRLGTSYVLAYGEAEFTVDWTRRDESRLDYQKEFPSEITFTREAYESLLKLEQSNFRCEFTNVTVERFCNNAWQVWFTGRISFNDATWNLDRCTVEMKVDEMNPEVCFNDNKSQKFNLFSLIEPNLRRSVRIYPDYVIDYVEYQEQHNSASSCKYPAPYFPGPLTAAQFGYGWYYHTWSSIVNLQNGTYTCYRKTKWARYFVSVLTGTPSPGAEWLLINTANGFDYYVKPVSTFNCKTTTKENPDPAYNIGVYSQETTCEILGKDASISVIDNGMHLRDILNKIIPSVCPGVTVVSDFFQINPKVSSMINYVTQAPSKVTELVLYQKSDVKRPNASNNATKAEITADQLIEALVSIFNVRWWFENNTFRIEHVSYKTQANGLNLTRNQYKKYVEGKRVYSYATEKIPQREEFTFMEARAGDFAGLPIVYSGACVSKDGRNNISNIAVENITTDVELCLNNPDSDSKVVDDKGFVLMAAAIMGIELNVITEAPILSAGASPNNSLAWAQLHRDYHRHYRPLQQGNMNGIDTAFFSSKPIKKGAQIIIPLCCDDLFNPDDKITTPLGIGIVDKASYSFRDQSLTLDLIYETGEGPAATHEPPLVLNTGGTIYASDPISLLLNIAVSVTLDDAVDRLEVGIPPSKGHVTILNASQIVYYPAAVMSVGVVNFTLFAYDTFNVKSNEALITIQVI